MTGFRFRAGALAGTALTAALDARIGNDVELPAEPALLHRLPGTAQTGFPNTAGFHQITMDTVGALPRGGNGDNYGGWSASNHWYASQVAGWYLVIADLYAVPPPAGTARILTAGIFCSSSGGVTPVSHPGQLPAGVLPDHGHSPPGAFAMGMYYLQPGEYVYPMLSAASWGGTWGTQVSTGTTGTIHSQLSVFWCSSLSCRVYRVPRPGGVARVPDSALLSVLSSAGVAGVFCVLFIIGAIVPRFVVNDLKAELAEKEATIAAERDRANAAVAAASATRDILAAIQLGRVIGTPVQGDSP